MSKFTDEQIEKEFRRIDKNDNKSITMQELRNYYIPMQEMLGVAPQVAEQEIQGFLKQLDTDNDKLISFEGKNNSFYSYTLPYFSLTIFFLEFKKFLTRN